MQCAKESSSSTIINLDGAAAADDVGTENGAAYVFRRDGSNWVQDAYLKASNSNSNDFFGTVTMSQGLIAVGAYGEGGNVNLINNNDDSPTHG